jgi:ATP-binding cassette subfamily C protein
MKLARIYGLEFDYVNNFFVITDKISGQGVHFIQVDATTKMYHQIGAIVAVSAFFYMAANFVSVPATNLLLLVFVFARLAPKISIAQHYIQHIANSLPAYHASSRMLEQLEAASESPRPSSLKQVRLKNAIRFNRVSYSYTDSREPLALRGIDIVIPAEHTVAIVGPSGSGKTTLVDLIMGLLSPTEGRILIDEEPLTGALVHNWRNSIGCVPQETFLFHDTIRNNLLWSRPDATEKDLWEAIGLSAAEGFVSALPEGLDTVVGDRGVRLSGGERQRIALARALLRKPTLLVLDEATSNLDTENERHIQDAIEGLHGELTMVFIAQHLSTVRKADKIVVLEEGLVLEIGTWEALSQKKDGRFRTLLEQQC